MTEVEPRSADFFRSARCCQQRRYIRRAPYFGGFFIGLRVRMQPQTMNAVTIAQKITNGISCIVMFSVA